MKNHRFLTLTVLVVLFLTACQGQKTPAGSDVGEQNMAVVRQIYEAILRAKAAGL